MGRDGVGDKIRLLLLLAVTASTQGTQPWEPHFLKAYPAAVCNDGSPAVYYYRAGTQQSRHWLVYLEGGLWCWDKASCKPGTAGITTSVHFPREPKAIELWASHLRGFFDDEGSAFAGAHIAYVRTCSNDAFMGDSGASGPGSWHYRGSRIVEAAFADLRKKTGLGARFGDRVVYGGCSAGARGAIVSIDYVATFLVGKADVLGMFDSAFWVPVQPLHPDYVTAFEDQTALVMTLHNSSLFISDECERAHPGTMRWKCLFPAYRLPFVRTPYIVSHSQYDKFSINWNLRRGAWLPKEHLNNTVLKWSEQYRQKVIDYLPIPEPGTGVVVFSAACYFHCSTMFKCMHQIRVHGTSLMEFLAEWLTPGAPAKPTSVRLQDKCKGFDCGECCKLMPVM